MRTDNFSDVLKKEWPSLHALFYRSLKGAYFRGDIEDHIQDLIQITSLRTYLNSQKENLLSYTTAELLSLKARNEIANFFQLVKKNYRFVSIDHATAEPSRDPDPFEQLVLREEMRQLETVVNNPDNWQLLHEAADEIPYQQLAAERQTTEAAIKMKICRLRKQIWQRLRRP